MPSSPTSTGDGEEGAGKADMRRQHHGEIGADRVEAAMGQVDDAAEREDQRQAERDQKVIGADQQPVQHLLEEEDELHAGFRVRPLSRTGEGQG